MRTLPAILSIALLLVAGCAKRPESITPVNIPSAAYSNLDCQTLSAELLKEQQRLAVLTKKQKEAAAGDAIGVFLIGVPTASITGHDNEGDLSVSKGKVLALETQMLAKSCASQAPESVTETAETTS